MIGGLNVWPYAVVALALSIGAVAWLRVFRHRTAVSWVTAALVMTVVGALQAQHEAPAPVVDALVRDAVAAGCAAALNALPRGDRPTRASWMEIAGARVHLLRCTS